MKAVWNAARWLAALSMLQLAAPAAAQAPATAPTGKFGFVNTERILREAVPAVRAQKKIEGEFKKRDDELAKMAEQLKRQQEDIEKNAVTMGEAQDLNQRRNEELAQVVEHAQRVIRQIAEQEKYDIIFQDVVYFSPRIDITEKVIKALDAAKPAAK
jgi:outer membrane protein